MVSRSCFYFWFLVWISFTSTFPPFMFSLYHSWGIQPLLEVDQLCIISREIVASFFHLVKIRWSDSLFELLEENLWIGHFLSSTIHGVLFSNKHKSAKSEAPLLKCFPVCLVKTSLHFCISACYKPHAVCWSSYTACATDTFVENGLFREGEILKRAISTGHLLLFCVLLVCERKAPGMFLVWVDSCQFLNRRLSLQCILSKLYSRWVLWIEIISGGV